MVDIGAYAYRVGLPGDAFLNGGLGGPGVHLTAQRFIINYKRGLQFIYKGVCKGGGRKPLWAIERNVGVRFSNN